MEKMSKDEFVASLSAPARCAKLATICEDGRPHVVPVWFTLNGELVIFTALSAWMRTRRLFIMCSWKGGLKSWILPWRPRGIGERSLAGGLWEWSGRRNLANEPRGNGCCV